MVGQFESAVTHDIDLRYVCDLHVVQLYFITR